MKASFRNGVRFGGRIKKPNKDPHRKERIKCSLPFFSPGAEGEEGAQEKNGGFIEAVRPPKGDLENDQAGEEADRITFLKSHVFYKKNEDNPISEGRLHQTWTLWDYFRVNALIDFGPQLTLVKKAILFSGASIATGALYLSKNNRLKGFAARLQPSFWILLFLFGCLSSFSVKNHMTLGNQKNRDAYDAQLWAKNNTDPNAGFLTLETTWRGISERRHYQAVPNSALFYLPDKRIQRFNDRIVSLLRLDNLQTTNQKFWNLAILWNFRKKFDSAEKMRRLGKVTRTQYFVDTEDFALPIAYSNSTFKIYDLT